MAMPAVRRLLLLGLAMAMLFGATWAKTSRYDETALPSPHFSSSVKIARGLFQGDPGHEAVALIVERENLPRPDWSGLAPLPTQEELPGNPPRRFQALRAPPALA